MYSSIVLPSIWRDSRRNAFRLLDTQHLKIPNTSATFNPTSHSLPPFQPGCLDTRATITSKNDRPATMASVYDSESDYLSPRSPPTPALSHPSSSVSQVMSLSFIINNDNENTPSNHVNSIYSSDEEKKESPRPPTTTSGLSVNDLLNTVCAKPDCFRTIRGPPGSFCKYHKQSRFCRAEGCSKSAKTGGYCISHGGGKRCSHPDCTKSAKQGGLCISHGGGKRCNEKGCTKSALVGGFCSAHGGGRKCKMENCSKTALLGGLCIGHGGGKRCQVEGCSKSAVGGVLCVSHGGGKRCQAEGCNKGAVRNGVCIRHGAKRSNQTTPSTSQ